jgi:hypothetical protein
VYNGEFFFRTKNDLGGVFRNQNVMACALSL